MKPRLTYKHNTWACSYAGTQTGYGYTPMQAYREWLILRFSRMPNRWPIAV